MRFIDFEQASWHTLSSCVAVAVNGRYASGNIMSQHMDCLEKRQPQLGNFNVYLELSSSTNFSANIFCAFLCAPTKSRNVFSLSCPPRFGCLNLIPEAACLIMCWEWQGFKYIYICVLFPRHIHRHSSTYPAAKTYPATLMSMAYPFVFSPMANPKINCDFADNHPKYHWSVKLLPCLVYDTTIFKIL